ncbi:GyrI-like domain-containing protein [Vallitalea okinawensis]|uniref:GyrI-like domain-containing protein n=1 Tax=Vallitalea okinawensis TaxID=2078660 RepID=UPI000CFC72F8|nr:GyrI-like domain-containing protein [Vallitalea okinawensis]
MNYEIVELEDKSVIGLLTRTTNENMQAANDIGMLWQKFMSKEIYYQINHRINADFIGLYTDYEKDYTKPYNFMVGCEVSEIDNLDASLVSKTIKAGKYVKFSITGQAAVKDAWEEIWTLHLDRKYESDFEVYEYTDDLSQQRIHIYISVQ